MKKINKIVRWILPLIIFIAVFACKEGESSKKNTESETQPEITTDTKGDSIDVQVVDLEFKDPNIQASYENYNHIRTALIKGEQGEAKKAAELLLENSEGEKLTTALMTLIDAGQITDQRIAFADINIQLEPLFKENISSGTLYKQFCPMALNNEGAYWLSEVKEIRNPYFGEQMLKCGTVVETIN